MLRGGPQFMEDANAPLLLGGSVPSVPTVVAGSEGGSNNGYHPKHVVVIVS
jgi:hypothetical protein